MELWSVGCPSFAGAALSVLAHAAASGSLGGARAEPCLCQPILLTFLIPRLPCLLRGTLPRFPGPSGSFGVTVAISPATRAPLHPSRGALVSSQGPFSGQT